MPVYAKIYAVSVGTTPAKLAENQNRRALLIQNLSANILYILSSGNDTAQAVKLAQDEIYTNDVAPEGEYILIASAASSDIRVEEDIYQK